MKNKTFLERFEEKIYYSLDGCWYWLGGLNPDGYGQMCIKRVAKQASRVSYRIYKGEIPEGMHICHTCDNPSCVNPYHLWAGTRKDNMLDMVQKGRNGYTGRKLTQGKAEEIRVLAKNTHCKTIAKQFNVCYDTVKRIVRGEIWKSKHSPE